MLGIRVLQNKMLDLARRDFPEARVGERVNARGELVLAIIIPPRSPGEWLIHDAMPTRKKRWER